MCVQYIGGCSVHGGGGGRGEGGGGVVQYIGGGGGEEELFSTSGIHEYFMRIS